MRELYLEWLPVFGGILGGTILFIGLFLGACHSLKQVFGYSIVFLGGHSEEGGEILPLSLLRVGVFSITGGALWLHFLHSGRHIFYGMIIGGVFGLVYTGIVKKIKQLTKLPPEDEGFVRTIVGVRGIGPTLGGIFLTLVYLIAGAIIGGVAGTILGTLLAFLFPATMESSDVNFSLLNLKIILYGMMIGAIIGAILGGLRGITAGVKVGGKAVASIVVGIVAVGIVGGILGGFSGGISGFIRSALIMIAAIGISSGIYIILLPIEWMLASAISSFITPPLILLRFSTIICNNCLRYTRALKSKYKGGIRYCERCRKEVEFTNEPGEVLVSFGNIPLILEGRVFMLSDPDFERKTKFIEISEVYIDTGTCNRLLLEKFVTYIVNYPPEKGLDSVEIFYRGKLDDLGDNLKNSLQNNFEHIERID